MSSAAFEVRLRRVQGASQARAACGGAADATARGPDAAEPEEAASRAAGAAAAQGDIPHDQAAESPVSWLGGPLPLECLAGYRDKVGRPPSYAGCGKWCLGMPQCSLRESPTPCASQTALLAPASAIWCSLHLLQHDLLESLPATKGNCELLCMLGTVAASQTLHGLPTLLGVRSSEDTDEDKQEIQAAGQSKGGRGLPSQNIRDECREFVEVLHHASCTDVASCLSCTAPACPSCQRGQRVRRAAKSGSWCAGLRGCCRRLQHGGSGAAGVRQRHRGHADHSAG